MLARWTRCPHAPLRVFRAGELVAADPTAGMLRELAFELPMLWAGRVTTAPGAVSGWHHHDRNDSSLYVVSGILRLEFEGEAEPLDAMPATSCTSRPSWSTGRATRPTTPRSPSLPASAAASRPSTWTRHRRRTAASER